LRGWTTQPLELCLSREEKKVEVGSLDK
jgi:hypothetical protein